MIDFVAIETSTKRRRITKPIESHKRGALADTSNGPCRSWPWVWVWNSSESFRNQQLHCSRRASTGKACRYHVPRAHTDIICLLFPIAPSTTTPNPNKLKQDIDNVKPQRYRKVGCCQFIRLGKTSRLSHSALTKITIAGEHRVDLLMPERWE